ncbi:MAG: hypothetical protein KatS3mg102_1327 [Planctomycetota bacterium]|nr:MAG: hypothetical protein KatS3mg102_1327 [Planctomycetota bacterium]
MWSQERIGAECGGGGIGCAQAGDSGPCRLGEPEPPRVQQRLQSGRRAAAPAPPPPRATAHRPELAAAPCPALPGADATPAAGHRPALRLHSAGAAARGLPDTPAHRHLVLYDGMCGFCAQLLDALLGRERREALVFAALQSDLAVRVLARHHLYPEPVDMLYVVLDYQGPGERLLSRAEALGYVLRQLGWRGRLAAGLLGALPAGLRGGLYRRFASRRHHRFGRFSMRLVPGPQYRHLFLDL